MSDRAVSKTDIHVSLLVHGVAILPLFLFLVFRVPDFSDLFSAMQEKGGLPFSTAFMLFLYRFWYVFFPVICAIDVGVLLVLGGMPRRRRRVGVAWFALVLVGIGGLYLLVFAGIAQAILKMSVTL